MLIRATKLAVDSRYANIMQVMRDSDSSAPVAPPGRSTRRVVHAAGPRRCRRRRSPQRESQRFLAVVVIATPCPLLLAIPTAIIGSISLSARRAIIIKNPAVLEQIENCRTLIFDKTGTLTYGGPRLTDVLCAQGFDRTDVLRFAASVEQYSKHPLARAIIAAARQDARRIARGAHQRTPGLGLIGTVAGHKLQITRRNEVPRILRWPELSSDRGMSSLH